ncbi:hypothetical protein IMZ48_40910, partial [Candidatus Bathyarchaeota archaeon]|nr:hypothetical protein [Candidatus Bathyarchaeota archaeon]
MARLKKSLRSPKRGSGGENSRADWFPYHASFSFGFVEDTLKQLDIPATATLLDPWLGSGTSCEVALALGMKIWGYDLNPAMLFVSKARTVPSNATNIIPALVEEIATKYRANLLDKKRICFGDSDPLEQWLQPETRRAFRHLERTTAMVVLKQNEYPVKPIWHTLDKVTPYGGLLYLGLFRTLRYLISAVKGSNPTWVKTLNGKNLLHCSPKFIINHWILEIHGFLKNIEDEKRMIYPHGKNKCVIERATSLNLPLASESIDVVITSPPYCTRIDYVRATLPELAVINFPNGNISRSLRENLIGTPAIGRTQIHLNSAWGPTCLRFLNAVKRHPSKASSTYYLKYFIQYFSASFDSIIEIDRVMKKSSLCILVVQDSYYKERLNNL